MEVYDWPAIAEEPAENCSVESHSTDLLTGSDVGRLHYNGRGIQAMLPLDGEMA
jgi:hypothetical protein